MSEESHENEPLLDGRRPNTLAFLERVEISTRVEGRADLCLVGLIQERSANGWPDLKMPFHRIRILFKEIRGFRIAMGGGGPQQIMGFSIESIADRGWESLRFEVSDYEDDLLFFRCGDFEVLECRSHDQIYLRSACS